ncbi:MAG TPA: ricin-type beta-trefoil lectin domain protein [Actinocrinis sp.]|nr:ricin-type beta-trefoil lectin domain protein [Actinocrinis sp.]
MAPVHRRTRRRLSILTLLALIGSLLPLLGSAPAQAAAAAVSTSITVNGTSSGRTFDGIGAISGGGGNSRLLTNYPAAQQTQILDYLFKPGYGADLQILKVEIGGDGNSTDGSESSIEHTAGNVQCNTGYEFWLMEQAKALNPNIKLYGLAWTAPGWIGGGNFWSTDMINYLVSWLGCAKADGLTINYLGGWNERGYNISWYEQLRSTLNADGYSAVQIVGADSDWSVANDIDSNSAFANAVQIIGSHYPCGGDGGSADSCSTTSQALSSGKQLWASENGSQDENSGAPAMIRSIIRGYTDAKMTAYINWPLVAAIYPNLGYDTTGLMVANQPWSGAYEVGAETWTTAQVTQFTSPGWHFLDSGSGYLGGSESNGSYVTLKSTSGSDYSTILETTTATAAQTANFTVSGGLSTGAVHVWATNLASNNPADYFVHTQDITPTNGTYSLTLQPGYIYTVTTTTGQGKGTAASPAKAALALPYTDSFDSYATGSEADLLSDQNGAFQAEPCTGRSGQCVQQVAAQSPINWDGASNPYTLLGDLSWANYKVSADALMQQSGAVQLLGRVETQQAFAVAGINDYYLQLSSTGAWSIVKNTTSATLTTLKSGTIAAPGTGTWHNLALSFQDSTITAAIDGTTVGTVTDSSYFTGQVGLGVDGYQTDEFDNLAITPLPGGSGTYTTGPVTSGLAGLCLDDAGDITTDGNKIDINTCNNSAAQQWTPANGAMENNGMCLDVVGGSSTADGTLVDLWTCNGGANQVWEPLGNGELLNPQSGKCLDDPGGTTTPGTQVEIWDCNDGANQQWTVPPVVGPVASGLSGLCLDDNADSTTDGNKIDIYGCNNTTAQQWELTAGTLRNNGKCLDVVGPYSTADGTLVDLWTCNGGANQVWQPQANGELLNPQSGKCLDDPGSTTTPGTQVEIWDCNNGANQHWTLPSA